MGMIYRMQEYYAILRKKYKIPVEQIVIYLDKKPSKMQTQLPDNEVFKGFQLLSLHQINYKSFLNSGIAEEVILAILCDFEEDKVEDVLEKIILTLKKINNNNIALEKYIRQILVLSRLRNLEEIFYNTIENNMGTTFGINIKNDIFYKRGQMEGKAEGEVEVEMQKSKQVAIKGIEKGFDNEMISELTGLSIAQIEQIRKEIK
ncbi:MAG: hypothetical protein EAZ06_02765 [Cytophagales bacterium]|nr:MAG: hypothetical protein EAZ06_02765 [Cytophagales bacterium]